MCKKNYTWNYATCSFENGKYLRSIIDNSVITCDKIIEETKNFPTKSSSTKTVPTNSSSANFSILLAFSLFTIALLTTLSTKWIKHPEIQKYLLPYHITNNKLKEVLY